MIFSHIWLVTTSICVQGTTVFSTKGAILSCVLHCVVCFPLKTESDILLVFSDYLSRYVVVCPRLQNYYMVSLLLKNVLFYITTYVHCEWTLVSHWDSIHWLIWTICINQCVESWIVRLDSLGGLFIYSTLIHMG